MSDQSDFRTWLKRRRQERGLTQEELGEQVGYAGQTIRKIENGRRRPSLQLALRLAQVLQLAPEEQSLWMTAARAVAEPEAAAPAVVTLREPMPSVGLPAYLTPFVGREQEQAQLAALLDRADCRLVTLLGPGGVGKTRLAIETARMIGGFSDGIAFVSLAAVAAPSAIVSALGDALGFTFAGSSDLLTQLLAYLRDRHSLLILDNLEHLLDPAGATLGLLGHILTQAPDVTVLVTSRERLRLAGEWILEIGGLAVPQLHATTKNVLYPTVTLFVEHAQRVQGSFRLTRENESAIATICRLMDGLPLGIELAAAWIRMLSLEEIAQELTANLDIAHLSPGALPARHHSLRSVVDHSWRLLTDEERQSLRRLAVFQGGFTREAAAQVAGAGLAVLANLADKSLLRRGARGRYDLHEIIRQFADERLREQADDLSATRGRHAAYYLRLVAEREWRLKGAEQAAVVGELTTEIDNIRAAWPWSASHAMLEDLERAGEVLQWFYEFRSWLQEGTALFGQAVQLLRTNGVAADRAGRTLGRLLGHYGYLSIRSGENAQAHAALAESYTLLADEADPVGLGRTLYNQATAARWDGSIDEARRLVDRSLALTYTTGDRHMRAMTLTVANNVFYVFGEYEQAERLFRQALALWRELGNPRGMVWCITSCSLTLLTLGKHQEAQQLLQESLALSYASDDRYGTATTLRYLGLVAFQLGDVEAAIYFLSESLPQLRSTGNLEYPQALNDLGAAHWQAGAQEAAHRVYAEALAEALRLQAVPDALRAAIGIATCLAQTGDYCAALGLAMRVLSDPASLEQTRRTAAAIRLAAQSHLSAVELSNVEGQAIDLPLTAIYPFIGPARERE